MRSSFPSFLFLVSRLSCFAWVRKLGAAKRSFPPNKSNQTEKHEGHSVPIFVPPNVKNRNIPLYCEKRNFHLNPWTLGCCISPASSKGFLENPMWYDKLICEDVFFFYFFFFLRTRKTAMWVTLVKRFVTRNILLLEQLGLTNSAGQKRFLTLGRAPGGEGGGKPYFSLRRVGRFNRVINVLWYDSFADLGRRRRDYGTS